MSGQRPAGLHCPGCDEHAVMALPGQQQAFCGNEDCAVIVWDTTKTLAELAEGMHTVDLTGLEGS